MGRGQRLAQITNDTLALENQKRPTARAASTPCRRPVPGFEYGRQISATATHAATRSIGTSTDDPEVRRCRRYHECWFCGRPSTAIIPSSSCGSLYTDRASSAWSTFRLQYWCSSERRRAVVRWATQPFVQTLAVRAQYSTEYLPVRVDCVLPQTSRRTVGVRAL